MDNLNGSAVSIKHVSHRENEQFLLPVSIRIESNEKHLFCSQLKTDLPEILRKEVK